MWYANSYRWRHFCKLLPLRISWRTIRIRNASWLIIGSLSKDVFERRTSAGSEVFSLFICLDTTKFVLLSFFSPIKTIYLRVSTKLQPNAAKSPLPVDVRRSKTLLLKFPINYTLWQKYFCKGFRKIIEYKGLEANIKRVWQMKT